MSELNMSEPNMSEPNMGEPNMGEPTEATDRFDAAVEARAAVTEFIGGRERDACWRIALLTPEQRATFAGATLRLVADLVAVLGASRGHGAVHAWRELLALEAAVTALPTGPEPTP